jgi:glucose-1-phosphate cytidylyltransferase
MPYYSQFGHKDFVLCLGYKANVIKESFLKYKPQIYADCVVWGSATSRDPRRSAEDRRIAMIDTGTWRNIGQRLWAVREYVAGEEMFFALQRRPLRREFGRADGGLPRDR